MMKTFLLNIFLLFINYSYSQSVPEWVHFEGVENKNYKVYYDKHSIIYDPGKTIIVNLKYDYINSETIQSAIHKVKFLVDKNAYDELDKIHYYKSDTSYISELSNIRPLIPSSEMSIIYQYLYIAAVTLGPTK